MQGVVAYKEKLKERDDHIKALVQQLQMLRNSSQQAATNQEAAAKKKCSLNNAYRLAGTARSTIGDFLGIVELRIVNKVTYQSTLERLGDPKLSVKSIEQEC